MDERGMGTEPLADSVRKAQAAMQELRMDLHYLHCDGLGERATAAKRVGLSHARRHSQAADGPSVTLVFGADGKVVESGATAAMIQL